VRIIPVLVVVMDFIVVAIMDFTIIIAAVNFHFRAITTSSMVIIS
jgi:hypothetical protein